ncbi:hydroxyisourate hydrolase [Rubripirellula amarantea]|nr:hydroxyisourate hydrolase [Rubripirellula amarantea]
MTGITSHVLDTSLGKPGAGIRITLEQAEGSDWISLGEGITNDDGRVADLSNGNVTEGEYQITFFVAQYFEERNVETFYPIIRIAFSIVDAQQHYHVPLLLNPFGFSTYRGS